MPRQLIFRNFVTLGTDYEGYNWKDDLPRLCFMLYTPIFGILWKYLTILEFITKEAAVWSLWRPLCDFWNFQEKMENFGFLLKISRFWKIISFNFQRSRLMTLGRVYNHKILFFSQCFGHWRGLSNSNPLVLDGTWMARTRVSSEHWWLITEWWSLLTGIW